MARSGGRLAEQVRAAVAAQDICPWARMATKQGRLIVHAILDRGPSGAVELRQAARSFGAAGLGSCMVAILSAVPPHSFERFAQIVFEGYRLLRDAVIRVYFPRKGRAERARIIEEELRLHTDPTRMGRPMWQIHGKPVLVTAFGPVYPLGHPRFLPAPALTLVWIADFVSVPVEAKERTRRLAESRVGCAYDADELLLRPVLTSVTAALGVEFSEDEVGQPVDHHAG